MTTSTEFQIITSKHQGWTRMWNAIKDKFGDVACEENGESWQYMGTTETVHEFRHRCLNGERTYFGVSVIPSDFDMKARRSRK